MSRARVIVDTGPLVAFMSARDAFHAWAREAFEAIDPPAITAEAVLAEAFHLLRGVPDGRRRLWETVQAGAFTCPIQIIEQADALASLMSRYANVPMSLADACIVRLVEGSPEIPVLTIDSDFRIYRHSGRRQIRVVMPPGR